MGLDIRKTTFKLAEKTAKVFGFDLTKHTYRLNPDLRLGTLFKHYGVNLLFDVGANVGQYGLRMKEIGYQGQIVSFEPLSSAFAALQKEAKNYSNWKTVNAALGESCCTARINVSENSQSSSLLASLPRLTDAAPQAAVVSHEDVSVRTLDSVFADYNFPGAIVFLKIDAQGYEQRVLAGAAQSMSQIAGIQLEAPIVELYEGEMLFRDALDRMRAMGFNLSSLEYGFADPKTGHLLEVDGIFFRANEAKPKELSR